MDLDQVDQIIDRHGGQASALIQVLLDVQAENNWLPSEALQRIKEKLQVPESRIRHITTFYKAFSLVPRGKHVLQCCVGTACHVRGAGQVVDRLSRELEIGPGETTPDGKFTLEDVRCVGCCAIAPVVKVGDEMHGRLSQVDALKLLEKYS